MTVRVVTRVIARVVARVVASDVVTGSSLVTGQWLCR